MKSDTYKYSHRQSITRVKRLSMHIVRIIVLAFMTTTVAGVSAQNARLKMFDDEQKQYIPSVYAKFIERAVGELATLSEPQASQTASRYQMQLTTGDSDMTSAASQWAKDFVSKLPTLSNFAYADDNDYLDLSWDDGKSVSFSIKVKITREAIEGTDKAEADKLELDKLMSIKASEYTPNIPAKKQLTKTAESDLLVLKGESYIINDMNADTYYRTKWGTVKPEFDKHYPVESLKNLMQSLVQNDHKLTVNVSMYGGKTQTFTIRLKDFTDYWKSNPDYDVYCSVSKAKNKGQEKYEVVHIAKHKLLRYANISIITFNGSDFDNSHSTLSCITALNVPQHNISNLFPEK